jgi:heme exporter protein D
MVDLGQYAGPVIGAYAGTIALLIGLVVMSALRARRVKRQLAVVEARRVGSTAS